MTRSTYLDSLCLYSSYIFHVRLFTHAHVWCMRFSLDSIRRTRPVTFHKVPSLLEPRLKEFTD